VIAIRPVRPARSAMKSRGSAFPIRTRKGMPVVRRGRSARRMALAPVR
jgi:hypothetical protein